MSQAPDDKYVDGLVEGLQERIEMTQSGRRCSGVSGRGAERWYSASHQGRVRGQDGETSGSL